MENYAKSLSFVPTMKPLDTPKSENKPEEVGIIGGAKGTVEIEIKDEPIDFSNVSDRAAVPGSGGF